MSALGITIILAMVLAAGVFLLFTIINNISVCPPSEVLIFSGRTRRLADGRLVVHDEDLDSGSRHCGSPSICS